MLSGLILGAVCLVAPVNGPVIAAYSPSGSYAGHWGIDYGVPAGTAVRAPASGRVTFAGTVAGMRSVTIEPVSGLKVSISYLAEIGVSRGESVTRGQVIGFSGSPHGTPGVHFSTRIDGEYVDPARQLGCRETDITRALRLVAPPAFYSRRRAHWHSRRDLRPDPHRPPPRGGGGDVPGQSGSHRVHPGG